MGYSTDIKVTNYLYIRHRLLYKVDQSLHIQFLQAIDYLFNFFDVERIDPGYVYTKEIHLFAYVRRLNTLYRVCLHLYEESWFVNAVSSKTELLTFKGPRTCYPVNLQELHETLCKH